MHEGIQLLWKDRKRILGLPVSFTRYSLCEDRLFLERGFLTTVHDEVALYRVRDVRVTRTLWQKLFGVGTITVFSADRSNPELPIQSVKRVLEVKELLVRQVEEARRRNNIRASEMMMNDEIHLDSDCGCTTDDAVVD